MRRKISGVWDIFLGCVLIAACVAVPLTIIFLIIQFFKFCFQF